MVATGLSDKLESIKERTFILLEQLKEQQCYLLRQKDRR
jgi:hypothetical protein